MMTSRKYRKAEVTDLNIAINYLVIERILTCLGIYHTIKEKLDIEAANIGIYGAIIQKAKQDAKDVIFITDDEKEDWFNKYNGDTYGC